MCSPVQRPPLPQDGTYRWLCPAGNKSTVIMIMNFIIIIIINIIIDTIIINIIIIIIMPSW